MAVKLRLRRMGRKKQPFYRIVAADSRSPRNGRFIEEIGYYNPLNEPITLNVHEDRALYWLKQGAIPTDTVKSLLRRKGIILRFDLLKQGVTQEKLEEEIKKWELLNAEREKRLALKREMKGLTKADRKEEQKEKEDTAVEKEEKTAPAEETPVADEAVETEAENATSSKENE